MTFPKSPARYPPEFLSAFEAASRQGELHIPTSSPSTLQSRLWAFARALRLSGQESLADSISISKTPSGLLLRHRSFSPEAREIAAALQASGAPDPSETLFDSLK